MDKIFDYFIVYSWNSSSGSGFGNTSFAAKKTILTLEHIREIEKRIEERQTGKNIVIMSFQLLSTTKDGIYYE